MKPADELDPINQMIDTVMVPSIKRLAQFRILHQTQPRLISAQVIFRSQQAAMSNPNFEKEKV